MRLSRRVLVSLFASVASVASLAGAIHVGELSGSYLRPRVAVQLPGLAPMPAVRPALAAAQLNVQDALAFIAKVQTKPPPPWLSADRRVRAAWRAWLVHLAFAAWLEGLGPTALHGFTSWDCVAQAETSGDWHAHSSKYSSAFGMLNQAVRERADSPASAQRILNGTASRLEQIHAASREVAVFGVRAWGALTVAKCT